MAKIALFGANGYLGRAVAAQLLRAGHEVSPLPARRLRMFPEDVAHRAESLFDSATVDDVGVDVLGHDAVVNAAGLASAAGRTIDQLYGANAAWPALAALACERAGVPRLVHVSSTAVQGLSPVLDDLDVFAPVDSYGASRVRGEQLLAGIRERSDTEVVIYRPPSLYGAGRRPSYPLGSLHRRLPLFVVGAGDQPVAAAHVTAVSCAVAELAVVHRPPAVATHPGEGHTLQSIYRLHEPGRPVVRVPDGPVRAALRLLRRFGDEPRAAAARRRVLVALSGQAQVSAWTADPARPADPVSLADHASLAEIAAQPEPLATAASASESSATTTATGATS